MIAIAIVLTLTTLITPSTAQAWGTPIDVWPQSTIQYCFDGGYPYSSDTAKNNVRSAIENWDSYMTNRSLVESSSGCDIHISWQSFYAIQWGTAPGRNQLNFTNGVPTSAYVKFNTDVLGSFWIYGANQNCWVYCPEPYDLWTIALHEIGHALGMRHNWTGGPLCTDGYFNTDTNGACTNDYYAIDIMYTHAADGYRRWLTKDSIDALASTSYR